MAYLPTRQPFFGSLESAAPASGTAYASIFGGNSSNTWATSSSWRNSLFPIAGTIIGFRLKVNVDPTAAGSYEFRLLKNGSTTGTLAVTISNGVLEAVNTSTMSIAAGDEIQIRCVVTGTPVAFSLASWSFLFEPTATKRCVVIGGTGNGTGDVITTEFQPAWGGYSWSASLTAQRASVIPIHCTIRRWRIEMTGSQGGTRVMTYYIYKNGVQEASSAIELTSADLEIGGLSIDVQPGDYLTIGCVTTGTAGGSAIFGSWGIEIEPDNDGETLLCGSSSALSTTTTQYMAMTNSSNMTPDTTEADRTAEAGVAERYILKALYVLLKSAPGAGDTRTFTIRKNSGAGNLTVTISDTATSGSDTGHTDEISDGDELSLQSTLTGTPASNSPTWGIAVQMLWTENPLTKDADYTVVDENAITKGAQYEIADMTRIFSRGNYAALPTDDANLSTIYTVGERDDVALDDGVRIGLDGVSGQYAIHQYKVQHTDVTKKITVTWNGQSTVAPSTETVTLEIYNYGTTAWESLDTETAAGADTDFTLTGIVNSSMVDYYDGDGYITVRIYQQMP